MNRTLSLAFTLTLAAFLSVGITSRSSAQNIISYNEDAFGTIPASGTAGIIPAINWSDSFTLNNGQTGNDTFTNLVNNLGVGSGVNLTTKAFGLFQIQNSDPGLDANGTDNKRLLNGYLNAGSSVSTTTSSFQITNIPFTLYSIVVYFTSDTAGRTGTVSDGPLSYDFSTIGAPEISGTNASFVITTDTTGANPSADYAVFSNLSGTSQTITANVPQFGGLAGFQIVSVPEPGTCLLVLGGSVLLLRRRRKC